MGKFLLFNFPICLECILSKKLCHKNEGAFVCMFDWSLYILTDRLQMVNYPQNLFELVTVHVYKCVFGGKAGKNFTFAV